MKKVLTLTAALLAFSVTLASADGLNLLVNNCGLDGGLASASWSCTASTGNAFQAIGSVVLPANVVGLISAATEIVVTNPAGPIPAYWTNTCRTGAFVQFFDPGTFPLSPASCPDIWSYNHVPTNAPLGVANVYEPGSTTVSSGMVVGANQMVLAGGGVLAGADAQDLIADGTELSVFELRVTRVKSSGGTACLGCATPVNAALTGLWLGGAGGTDLVRGGPTTGSPCLSLQGAPGSGLQCTGIIVPTVNKTWGAVKAMYR